MSLEKEDAVNSAEIVVVVVILDLALKMVEVRTRNSFREGGNGAFEGLFQEKGKRLLETESSERETGNSEVRARRE